MLRYYSLLPGNNGALGRLNGWGNSEDGASFEPFSVTL
jgi:hypothetical protein